MVCYRIRVDRAERNVAALERVQILPGSENMVDVRCGCGAFLYSGAMGITLVRAFELTKRHVENCPEARDTV